jgi:hypothetical protein
MLILLTTGAWYEFAWLRAQHCYLDDRNFRMLRTLSEQINSSITTFDKMMDNATESGVRSENIQAYLKNVAPQLEKSDDSISRRIIGDDYGDPPRLAVAADQGTNFLYLAFKHDSVGRFVIRTDLTRLVARLTPPTTRCPFDAILIAQSDGTVIYQASSMGLVIAGVNSLQDAFIDDKKPGNGKPVSLESFSQFSRLEEISLAGATYRLYSQPLQLPFGMAEPHRGAGKAEARAPVPERWILWGLIGSDRFRADSRSVSTRYVVFLSIAILLACSAYPFLKLYLSSRSERFKAKDLIAIAAGACFAASIGAVAFLDLGCWYGRLAAGAGSQMQQLASAMDTNFENEKERAFAQLQDFYADAELRSTLDRLATSRQAPTPKLLGGGESCAPSWACRTNLRSNPGVARLGAYPYLLFATWSDANGTQRVKWTTRTSMTPFLQLDKAGVAYYPPIRRAFQSAGQSAVPSEGVGSQYSPNTGDNVTVFWKLMDVNGTPISDPASQKDPSRWFCASIVAKPISVYDPILPDGFQFAVIRADGVVVFHSDHTRNLRENFFSETDQNKEVRARVTMRAAGSLVTAYMGRPVRMYIHPMHANADEQWAVVIFRDLAAEDTANLETISLAPLLLIIHSGVVGIILLAMARVLRHRGTPLGLWPDSTRARAYRCLTGVNACAAAAILLLTWLPSPLTLLGCSVVIIAGAMALNLLFLALGKHKAPPPRTPAELPSAAWHRWYVGMCATGLMLVAVAPCVMCFKIACNFEQKLQAENAQLKLAADIDERKRNMSVRDQATARMQFERELANAPGGQFAPYLSYHGALRMSVHLAEDYNSWRSPEPCGLNTAERQGRCVDILLSWFSPSYNQLAVDTRLIAQSGSSDRWTWFSASAMGKQEVVLTKKESCHKVLTIASSWESLGAASFGAGYWTAIIVLIMVLIGFVRSTLNTIFFFDLPESCGENQTSAPCDSKAYLRIFSQYSLPQKLALVQIAQEGLINPKARPVVGELIREGLVTCGSGVVRIDNQCFAEFLETAIPPAAIEHWEREGSKLNRTWIRTSLLASGIAVGGFVLYTQSNALNTWVAYLTGLAAIVPACLRLLEILRPNR